MFIRTFKYSEFKSRLYFYVSHVQVSSLYLHNNSVCICESTNKENKLEADATKDMHPMHRNLSWTLSLVLFCGVWGAFVQMHLSYNSKGTTSTFWNSILIILFIIFIFWILIHTHTYIYDCNVLLGRWPTIFIFLFFTCSLIWRLYKDA